jgi:glutathionylspermidine synthase
VRKPALGREGQNVQVLEGTRIVAHNEGIYDTGLFVFQQFGTGANFDGITPNLGVWMVNDEACGMGIREDDSLIVANGSRFVPHIFE